MGDGASSNTIIGVELLIGARGVSFRFFHALFFWAAAAAAQTRRNACLQEGGVVVTITPLIAIKVR